jgi:hypothetical protein
MSTRKKRLRDADQLAKSIVDIATGETDDREPTPTKTPLPSGVRHDIRITFWGCLRCS